MAVPLAQFALDAMFILELPHKSFARIDKKTRSSWDYSVAEYIAAELTGMELPELQTRHIEVAE